MKKCENCPNNFRVVSYTRIQKFCSLKCFHTVWKKNRPKGEKANNWKGGKIKTTCFGCAKEFNRAKSTFVKHNFCGRDCFNKSDFRLKGENNPNWKGGIILTEIQKKRKANMERTGKQWNWVEDRTLLKKDNLRNDSAYKEWRKQVWLRDNFKCKIANPDCKGKIEAHHILGWKDYLELRYQLNNGITLCHAHHPRKRSEEAKLSPYFQKLVAEKS